MHIRKIIHSLKKTFYLNVILKDIPMFDTVRHRGYVFNSTSYLSLGGKGTLKLLAETTKESSIEFSSLGKNEILKSKKKLSIISQTSFM
jgi:hypothetical protein